MIGVTQSILAGDQEGVYGNCLQAAVATLLDLPLDAVPHFSQFVWWSAALELWARGHNLTVRTVETTEIPMTGACIVGGTSPRGVAHVIVMRDGKMWDPHPSRLGLSSVIDAMYLDPWPHEGVLPCWVCGHRRGEERPCVMQPADDCSTELPCAECPSTESGEAGHD